MIAGMLNAVSEAIGKRVFASLENPRFSLNDPSAYDYLTGGRESDSGIKVSPEIALTLAPVWQAVSIISGDIATATAHVFQRDTDGNREIDDSHDADFLISEQPNEEMCAFDFWRRFAIHLLLWQNGFAYIDRVGRVGRVNGLYNLLPDRTCAKRDDKGNLYYVTEVAGELVTLLKEEVLHVKGLSIESGHGCSLVEKARDSWGLSLAAQGFASKYFKNGSQTGGIIETPPTMTEKARNNLTESIQKKHTGQDNWFKVMVLRDGAKFHATTIDAQKSQLIELREHQVRDTARFFNMPPGKLGLEDSVSYNSAEQSQIQYVTGCLTHWFSAIRGESQLKLLTEQQRRRRTHFIDFNTSKLYERDLKTTVDILAIERQNEIINAAEWRKKRDLPPRTDEAALEYVNPNTKSNPSTPEPASDSESNAMEDSVRSLLRDASERMARRVSSSVKKLAKSGVQFEDFLESRCASQQKGFEESMQFVAGVVAAHLGRDLTALRGEIQMRFFSELIEQLDPSLNEPASELESNVQAACLRFESQIANTLEQSVFGSLKNETVTN